MKPRVKKLNARKTCKDEDIFPLQVRKEKENNNDLRIQSHVLGNKDSHGLDSADNIEFEDSKNIEHDKDKIVSNSEEVDGVLLVGDLVWARIPGHCWWPSMISYDPNAAVYFEKSEKTGKILKFHVQFFGDESMRGWASASNVIKFEGKEVFLNLPANKLGKQKNRFPQSKRKVSWDHAIIQAGKALLLDRCHRKLTYVFSYTDVTERKTNNRKANTSIKKKEPAPKKKVKAATSDKPTEKRQSSRLVLNKKDCVSKLPSDASTLKDNQQETEEHKDDITKLVTGAPKEVLPEQDHQNSPPVSENSSDSGIEDIGGHLEAFDAMEPAGAKRKRKQKVYEDYHTGSEMATVMKFGLPSKFVPAKYLKTSKMDAAYSDSVVSSADSEIENIAEPLIFRPLHLEPDHEKENLDDSETISVVKDKNDNTVKNQCVEPTKKGKASKTSKVGKKKEEMTVLKRKSASSGASATKKPRLEPNSLQALPNTVKVSKNLGKTAHAVSLDSEDNTADPTKVKLDPRDLFCALCEDTKGDLLLCSGACFNAFHLDCLGLNCKPKSNFRCDECQTGYHACFYCKKAGDLTKCSQINCGKFYHISCLQELPETKFDAKTKTKFFCPLHTCKYCSHQDKAAASVNSSKNLLKCIRCPTSYHPKTCFIAGCAVLTPKNMICDNHFEVTEKGKNAPVNVTWCFVCSRGGSLVCCDTCPASFHTECIDNFQEMPNGNWQCQDCRDHKKPKYGDIIWIKFAIYRWWPGKICLPNEVPERIQNLPHKLSQFPVYFFGSKDYTWVDSRRVFKYEEGDTGGACGKKSLAVYFRKALAEASEAYALWKKERELENEVLDKRKSNKPPPYKSIKSNRPVTCIRTVLDPSEWPVCECKPTDPCSAESECLNRMLLFECNPKTCSSGEVCQNQRMQKNQYVKCLPFKCENRGWGLRAGQDIKQGDFVIEYVGELIDEDTCHKRIKYYHDNDVYDYYFLTIDRDNIIDACPKGNLSRFMNHSCDPNCETQKWTVNGEVRVGLFANRDIGVGDELCFNYNLDCLGNEKKQCKCGSKNCSGFLGVKAKTQHSMSVAEKAQSKLKKQKEKRKQKREKIKQQKVVHDDDCFTCGDGGELILCSRNKCTKSYHVSCLNIDKKPRGKWECPWHYCDGCGKRAELLCVLCPNSFCSLHKEGEIVEMKKNIHVCVDHTEKEIKEFMTKLENEEVKKAIPSKTETVKAEVPDGKSDAPIPSPVKTKKGNKPPSKTKNRGQEGVPDTPDKVSRAGKDMKAKTEKSKVGNPKLKTTIPKSIEKNKSKKSVIKEKKVSSKVNKAKEKLPRRKENKVAKKKSNSNPI